MKSERDNSGSRTGSRMGFLYAGQAKVFSPIKGKPLIDYQLDAMKAAGIDEVALVTGYRNDKLAKYSMKTFHNSRWQTTNMVRSLQLADSWLSESRCIVSYSDIFYESSAIVCSVKAMRKSQFFTILTGSVFGADDSKTL